MFYSCAGPRIKSATYRMKGREKIFIIIIVIIIILKRVHHKMLCAAAATAKIFLTTLSLHERKKKVKMSERDVGQSGSERVSAVK